MARDRAGRSALLARPPRADSNSTQKFFPSLPRPKGGTGDVAAMLTALGTLWVNGAPSIGPPSMRTRNCAGSRCPPTLSSENVSGWGRRSARTGWRIRSRKSMTGFTARPGRRRRLPPHPRSHRPVACPGRFDTGRPPPCRRIAPPQDIGHHRCAGHEIRSHRRRRLHGRSGFGRRLRKALRPTRPAPQGPPPHRSSLGPDPGRTGRRPLLPRAAFPHSNPRRPPAGSGRSLTALSQRSISTIGTRASSPRRLLAGPCRVAPLEYPSLDCRHVDVDSIEPAALAAMSPRKRERRNRQPRPLPRRRALDRRKPSAASSIPRPTGCASAASI